jgi:hypothetical protein
MSYFRLNQDVQLDLYASGGGNTLTLTDFNVVGGATLTVTNIYTHFHRNYASNTVLSNTSGYYPPGADNSLLYTPDVEIPSLTVSSANVSLSRTIVVNANARGHYVVVIGAGGGGGGGRNNSGDDNGNGGASGGSGAIVGYYYTFSTNPSVVLGTQTVENPVHPYGNTYTFDFDLTNFPTAQGITISFDALTATESGYDFVRLFPDAASRNASTRTSAPGAVYTNSGTGGTSQWRTQYFNVGSLYGRFTTDSSVVYYGFKLTATYFLNKNPYYKYSLGLGGSAGVLRTDAQGGNGGAGGSTIYEFYNSADTQVFTITAGGGTGGEGGKLTTQQPPPAQGGSGGTSTVTGSAASITTDTINVKTNGTNGFTNNVNAGGAAAAPVFANQNTNAGAYIVVGTRGNSGNAGNGDGLAAPTGSGGIAGSNGAVLLFELF